MRIALKRIWTVIMWILIMVFAFVILAFAPLIFFIGLFKIFWKRKVGTGLDQLGKDLRNVNLSLDELGCLTVFNWLDFSKDKPKFGIPGQKISYVLYLRHKVNKLTFLDKVIYGLITTFDKKHFEVFEDLKK